MKKAKGGAKWTWSALRPGAVIGFSLVLLLTTSTPNTPGRPCKTSFTQFALSYKSAIRAGEGLCHLS